MIQTKFKDSQKNRESKGGGFFSEPPSTKTFMSQHKKILLLTAGGSIVSGPRVGNSLEPVPLDTKLLYSTIPELARLADITVKEIFREDTENFTHEHWAILAQAVYDERDNFDGFVLTTGDTLPYTAAALAFALPGFGKPIVLHGDAISIFSEDPFGRENVLRSVLAARDTNLAGVYVVSGNKLIWGTRVGKWGALREVCASTIQPAVGEFAGLSLKLSGAFLKANSPEQGLSNRFNPKIMVRNLYPGLDPGDLFYSLLGKEPLAILIIAYSSGCLPNRGERSLLPFLQEAKARGVPVFSASSSFYPQTSNTTWYMGKEQFDAYELYEAHDMTYFSAIVKLMWILAQTEDKQTIVEKFYRPVANEISLAE